MFLRTKKGVCLSIDPRLRVPRHVRLFEKMVVSALFKMKVRASNGYLSLIRVVRNPITDHIPANTTIYRVERDGERIDHFAFAKSCGYTNNDNINKSNKNTDNNNNNSSNEKDAGKPTFTSLEAQCKAKHNQQFCPFAFVIGGMSKGDVNVDYALPQNVKSIRIADRGMSAAAVISELTHAFEECWLDEDNHTL